MGSLEGGDRDDRAKISSPGPSRDLKLKTMSLDHLQTQSLEFLELCKQLQMFDE